MLRQLNHSIRLLRPAAILFDTDNTLYEYLPANAMAELAVEAKVKNLLGVSSKLFRVTYEQSKLVWLFIFV